MHGLVHKTLAEFVVAETDDRTWERVADRAGLERPLYLPVSTYDDGEFEAILATLSSMAVQERATIERGVGRRLAPALLRTYDAYRESEWDLFDFLERCGSIRDAVDAATDDVSLPAVTASREGPTRVDVRYRTHRKPTYCALARGVLEGIASAYGTDATVTERTCVRDGDRWCAFRVELA